MKNNGQELYYLKKSTNQHLSTNSTLLCDFRQIKNQTSEMLNADVVAKQTVGENRNNSELKK